MVRVVAFAFIALTGIVAAAADDGRALNGQEIKDTISGRRIYLHMPLGEFPLYYRTDGVVDGSGQAMGLGRLMQPTDSGKWWIEKDALCQRWQKWYSGRQYCFAIRSISPGRIFWRRNDGLSGTARVAD